MLELFVEAGPQSGQRFALVASTVLGRGQFADLVIADLAVSRRHAQERRVADLVVVGRIAAG